MAIKHILYPNIKCQYLDLQADLNFDSNLLLLWGDSGEGKTLLAEMLKQPSDKYNIKVFDYRDSKGQAYKDFKSFIKNESGYLVVIDNADLLLDEESREEICLNNNNQYLIIGRNPSDLCITYNEIKKLQIKNNILTLTNL